MAHDHAPKTPLYDDMPKGLPRDYGHASATSLDEEQGLSRGPWAALLLGLVVALACAPMWSDPTALHLPASCEPYDAAIYPWNFFWAGESWGAEDGSPLFTRRMYHPDGESLALYTPTYLYGLFSLPLQWWLGPDGLHVAVVLFLTLSTVLTAWLTMALARRLGLTLAGSWTAGLLFALCAGRFMNAARLNLFCTEFLLALLLLLVVWLQRGGWLRAIAMGAAAAALLLQSQPLFFQGVLATSVIGLGFLGWRLIRKVWWKKAPHWTIAADPHDDDPTWLGAGLALGVFLLLGGPFLWAMGSALLEGGPGLAQSAAIIKIPDASLDVASLVVPTEDDRLYGTYLAGRTRTFFEGQAAGASVSFFLGFAWWGLVVWALVRGRARVTVPLLLAAVAWWALALGPTVRWMTEDITNLSAYRLLSWFPPVQLSKSPVRLVLLVQGALALLAGYGAQLLLRPKPDQLIPGWRRVAWLAAVVLLVLETSETLPLRSVEPARHIPAEVRAMANEPGDFTVLDLPFDDPKHFGAPRIKAIAQAFGAEHRRPIYFGLFPRATKANLDTVRATALFAHLDECLAWALQPVESRSAAPPLPNDVDAVRASMRELKIGAVQVHEPDDYPPQLRTYAEAIRVSLRALGPTAEDELGFGEGWRVTLFRFEVE